MSTLYCAVNRRTGTRGLPRHTMTEANLEFFLLKDSQDWYVVPVDLPPPPSTRVHTGSNYQATKT